MELSSPRFKALAISAGFSFWFFVITHAIGVFSLESFALFVVTIVVVTQALSAKVARVLDYVAIFNTKLFLGILFVFVISCYGIFFKILKIDLLRLKTSEKSYWLDVERLNESRIFKQY